MALPFLGEIPAATVSIVAAAVTVSIGIAARPVVENAISGLVISFSEPFRIGDTVDIDSFYGTIEDINITHTVVKLWDWKRYVIPNSQMLQSKFLNYSLFDTHIWAYIEFFVAYDADLTEVRRIAINAAEEATGNGDLEAPQLWIVDTDQQSARCWVAAWVSSPSERWTVTHEMRTGLIKGFAKAGIKTHSYRVVSDDEAKSRALAGAR